MMTNPWNIDEAFEPMFTDAIAIDSKNGKQTLNVVVFTDGDADVINPQMANTDIEYISVVCKHSDWANINLMAVGDKFEVFSTGKKYAIDNVDHDSAIGIVIHARSV